jgi:uncharacterized protein
MFESIESMIVSLVRVCCRRSGFTVVLASMMALVGVVYTHENIAINTDTSQLISSRLPWRQRELRFDAAFPQQVDTLLVVVDGATPELADSAAKTLAAALAKTHDHIQAVQEVGARSFFEQNGLLFLPVDEVRRTTEQLIRAQPFLGALAVDPTLRGLAEALRFIPEGERRGAIQIADFAKPLSLLSATINELLAGRPAAFSWSELMTGEPPQARELRRFIRVKPMLDFDALQPGAAASEAIRRTATELGLTPEKGLKIRLTGPVAIADDEFGTVADGALLNVLLTLAAVLSILWFALRSGRIILAVVVNLFVGLAVTSAVGLAMVGALNLISVAFAVLFVASAWISESSSRCVTAGNDTSATISRTPLRLRLRQLRNRSCLRRPPPPPASTPYLPTEYVGVSELGLIAGTGMIIAFLTSVTLLPALLTLLKPPPEPNAIGFRSLAPVDRFMARHRAPILVLATLAVAAGMPLFRALDFDFDPLSLRNARVESVVTKHFHIHPTVLSLILSIGQRFRIHAMRLPAEAKPPMFLRPWLAAMRRRLDRAGIAHNDLICGIDQSGAMDEAALLAALSRLSGGITEIYLHPATQYGIAHSMASYRPTDELAALLSPRVRAAMDSLDVRRGGFSDFWPARGAA